MTSLAWAATILVSVMLGAFLSKGEADDALRRSKRRLLSSDINLRVVVIFAGSFAPAITAIIFSAVPEILLDGQAEKLAWPMLAFMLLSMFLSAGSAYVFARIFAYITKRKAVWGPAW
jgi:hypothetical protein